MTAPLDRRSRRHPPWRSGLLGLVGGALGWLAITVAMPASSARSASPPPLSAASAAADGKGDRSAATAPPKSKGEGAAIADLSQLRAEYDRLREELFKARVRSQKAADAAYRSRLDARLRWKGAPDFVIRKARFLLDGAELWDSADRAQTDDLIEVAERSVKPGPHALTVRLEVRPKAEAKGGAKTGVDRLGYISEHTFAIVVAESGRTHLVLTADEDGDPPAYEPELELEVELEK